MLLSLTVQAPRRRWGLAVCRHRCLSIPWMYRCFLRLRTSPGFRVARAYGALQANVDHAGLYTIAGTPATTAVAIDFELDGNGFGDYAGYTPQQPGSVPTRAHTRLRPACGSLSRISNSTPTVQLAFSYVACDITSTGVRLVRRLRILTIQANLASSADHLLSSAEPSSVLSLILHKVGVQPFSRTWTTL